MSGHNRWGSHLSKCKKELHTKCTRPNRNTECRRTTECRPPNKYKKQRKGKKNTKQEIECHLLSHRMFTTEQPNVSHHRTSIKKRKETHTRDRMSPTEPPNAYHRITNVNHRTDRMSATHLTHGPDPWRWHQTLLSASRRDKRGERVRAGRDR